VRGSHSAPFARTPALRSRGPDADHPHQRRVDSALRAEHVVRDGVVVRARDLLVVHRQASPASMVSPAGARRRSPARARPCRRARCRLAPASRPLREPARQCDSVDELHRDEHVVSDRADLVDGDDVRIDPSTPRSTSTSMTRCTSALRGGSVGSARRTSRTARPGVTNVKRSITPSIAAFDLAIGDGRVRDRLGGDALPGGLARPRGLAGLRARLHGEAAPAIAATRCRPPPAGSWPRRWWLRWRLGPNAPGAGRRTGDAPDGAGADDLGAAGRVSDRAGARSVSAERRIASRVSASAQCARHVWHHVRNASRACATSP